MLFLRTVQSIAPSPTQATALAPRQQLGLSVVELFIAMTLGAGILLVLLNALSGTYHNNTLQKALIQVQQNGSFALNQITATLQHNRFEGCLHRSLTTNTAGISQNVSQIVAGASERFPIDDMAQQSLLGFTVTDTGFSPAPPNQFLENQLNALTPAPLVGSDVVISFNLSTELTPLQVSQDMATADDAISITHNSLGLESGDVIAITDCHESYSVCDSFLGLKNYASH